MTELPPTARNAADDRLLEAFQLDEWRLQALLKFTEMSGASLQEIADFALEEAVRLTRSQVGYLAFVNDDETVLTMHAWSKSAMAQCVMRDKPMVYLVANTGLWGEAIRQRRPVINNDYAAPNPGKKGYPPGHVAIRRHLNVPILDGEKIVAVAGVGNREQEYDESDVRQVRLLLDGMWWLIRRITEARRQQRLLQDIVDCSAAAIYVKDLQGRFLLINRWFESQFGVERDKVKGKTLYEILPKERADVFKKTDEEVLRAGKPLEFRIVCDSNGLTRTLATQKFPLLDDAGKAYAICGIAMDITANQEAEAARLHDMAHLAEDVEFPLRRISELAPKLQPEPSDRLRDLVGQAEIFVSQLKGVARTHLEFVRQPPQGRLERCREKVGKWFEVVPGCRAEVGLKELTIDRLGDDPFWANSDEVLYALRNLRWNARNSFKDKRPGDGDAPCFWIVYSARIRKLEELEGIEASGEYIVLGTADNGMGISPHLQERIFGTALQVNGDGRGVGSQIIRWVIDKHRGLIRYKTCTGIGTRIELWFPRLIDPHLDLNTQWEVPDLDLNTQWKPYEKIRETVGPVCRIETSGNALEEDLRKEVEEAKEAGKT